MSDLNGLKFRRRENRKNETFYPGGVNYEEKLMNETDLHVSKTRYMSGS